MSPAFKSHVRPNFRLTKTVRQHLMTSRHKRTAADLKVFATIINNLKLFATYPQSVRQGLTNIAYYEAREEGTVIVRQGNYSKDKGQTSCHPLICLSVNVGENVYNLRPFLTNISTERNAYFFIPPVVQT